jgi:hypothetical protein
MKVEALGEQIDRFQDRVRRAQVDEQHLPQRAAVHLGDQSAKTPHIPNAAERYEPDRGRRNA